MPIYTPVPHDEFVADIHLLAAEIAADRHWAPSYIIGIGRGGLVPAVFLSHATGLPTLSVDYSSQVEDFATAPLGRLAQRTRAGERLLLVDDINDSGGTIDYIRRLLGDNGCDAGNLRFAVVINNSRSRANVDYWADMIDRDSDKRWFVFPWESVGTNETIVEEALSVPERLA